MEFGSINTNYVDTDRLSQNFNRVYNDSDQQFYISKKIYFHGDEISFKYRYGIWIEDLYELTGDENCKNKIAMSIVLIPEAESLGKNTYDAIQNSCGYTEPFDILGYGCYLIFESETVEAEYFDDPKVINKLNCAANIIDTCDSLRGFYIDKPVNLLGMTGWDNLRMWIKDSDFKDILKNKVTA